jgi:hypothetical protein
MANGRTIQINIVPCLLGQGNHNRKEWLENRLEPIRPEPEPGEGVALGILGLQQDE